MKVCETIQFVNSKFTIYCEVKIFASISETFSYSSCRDFQSVINFSEVKTNNGRVAFFK